MSLKANVDEFTASNGNVPEKHSVSRTKESACKCDICERVFTSGRGLSTHISHKHVQALDRERTVKVCEFPTCTFKTFFVTRLKKHAKQHPRNLDGRQLYHSCGFCDYKSPYKARLEHHIRTHTKEKPYKCCFCEYSSAKLYSLHDHIFNKHTDKTSPKTFVCEFCDFRSSSKQKVAFHKRRKDKIVILAHKFKVKNEFSRNSNKNGKKKTGIKGEQNKSDGERLRKKFHDSPPAVKSVLPNIREGVGHDDGQAGAHSVKFEYHSTIASFDSDSNNKRDLEILNCKLNWCKYASEDNKAMALHNEEVHRVPYVFCCNRALRKLPI